MSLTTTMLSFPGSIRAAMNDDQETLRVPATTVPEVDTTALEQVRGLHTESKEALVLISQLGNWLVEDGRYCNGMEDLVACFCAMLTDSGLPVTRLVLVLFAPHPRLHGRSFRWSHAGDLEVHRHPHGMQDHPDYRDSAVRALRDGEIPSLRTRLDDRDGPFAYPLLGELAAQGISDYLLLPLFFPGSGRHALSVATERPGGFSDDEVAVLRYTARILAAVAEAVSARETQQILLTTYLGKEAANRVMDGLVRPGDGEQVDGVIASFTLHGLAELATELPPESVLGVSDLYFRIIIDAVHGQSGTVVKMSGDSVLALFRSDRGSVPAGLIAERALRACKTILSECAGLTGAPALGGLVPIRVVGSLHRGTVLYGNVGTAERMDFTIAGAPVGELRKIDNLRAGTEQPFVASHALAALCETEMKAFGPYPDLGDDEVYLYAPVWEDPV